MSQPQHAREAGLAGFVVAVCVSPGGIPKRSVDRAEVTLDGLVGDGRDHEKHRRPDRAISVQDLELIDQLVADGYAVGPGIMGENITVRGLHVQGLAVGDRLRFEDGPVIELASLRKPCYVLDSIHPELKNAVVGRCGFLCRVVQTGTLLPGQQVVVELLGQR
jgi:MOSC domain-containing protein YiiM